MTIHIPGRRALNFLGFAICAGLMGFALYAQHILLLDPCPLCVLQRVAVIALGAIALAAALHERGGSIWNMSIGLVLYSRTRAGVSGTPPTVR